MLHRYALVLALLPLVLRAQPFPTENAFPNLAFFVPTDLQHAGDGTDRLFVVEQTGRIQVFANDPATTQVTTFLDISSRVLSDARFGMLGLAFHPDYASNGFFYVHYTAANPQRSVIARFSVSAGDPNVADPNSELVLLEVGQPHNFHNGGALAFGPDDGFLYIPFGDGGPGFDPNGEGQDRTTLLATVLRIDVDNPDAGLNYGIPPDNPLVGNTEGWREEIWAWGLRNPWRISFDPVTGWLWAGENGEDRRDEINRIEAGKNYGWSVMEGSLCFSPMTGCTTDGLTLPLYEYSDPPRRSVIGGYVYRGSRTPELDGLYLFGDFVIGKLWSLEVDGAGPPVRTELASGVQALSTFGLDEQGEVYFAEAGTGFIKRFVPTNTAVEPEAPPASFTLFPPAPNPSTSGVVRLGFRLQQPAPVRLAVVDLLGREIAILAEGMHTADLHTAIWSPLAAAPGVYLARLTVDGGSTTQRFTVLR
ncbi:MAG: T9SS type A sorting domain-containing protein [Rhodothermaceae bacterium]|nr:T9SS type A sorting domain-containing protein [Rhodothermaceae bacterium]